MRRTVVVMVAALATSLAAAWPASGAPERAPESEQALADVNGDGFDDLAVGAPEEDVGTLINAGAVNALYGSATGLQTSGDLFMQGSGGVAGSLEAGDRFGAAIAKGDFDADGFLDVAVGAPGEDVGAVNAAGAVNILAGTAGGLSGGPLFTQDNPEAVDQFGAVLAAGDYNGDGFFDLAVGAPTEDVGATGDAGAVTVLFGGPGGLTTAGHQTLVQGGGGISGAAEGSDLFGAALASAIMAGDDVHDLVVGAPGENLGATVDAGAVNVLAGSGAGLVNGSLLTQGNPETDDAFGAAVATGDFDDTEGDAVNGRQSAGAVSVFNGSPGGLANERLLFQGTAGIPGSPETEDLFGEAVAPTDSNGIGQWDLAVGAPGEDIGPDQNAGAVNLLAGSATGPSGGSLVLQTNPEDLDRFGAAFAGGFFLHDFDNNGFFDLAVGAPDETVGTRLLAGAVSVFEASGGPGGVVAPGPVFTQGGGGLGGTAEALDEFGFALE
jgi:FG-GAP repeat